jgi:hypothetical protein
MPKRPIDRLSGSRVFRVRFSARRFAQTPDGCVKGGKHPLSDQAVIGRPGDGLKVGHNLRADHGPLGQGLHAPNAVDPRRKKGFMVVEQGF